MFPAIFYLADQSTAMNIGLFMVCGAGIAILGTRLTGLGDALADRTGLGEAFVGAVFLGACTSLPGITASVTAALDGFASMAIANAIGGIAVQTTFLILADLSYPKANLEHAAASVPNMLQGALLITLLGLLLVAMVGPQFAIFSFHPVTPLLFIGYGMGQHLIRRSHDHPMWQPRMTSSTSTDQPEEESQRYTLQRLWCEFIVIGALLVMAGMVLTRAAETIGGRMGWTESLVGGLMIAITTSLPELVMSLAAVRRGALTLAVGNVLGGNAFDTLFAAVADIAYRPGSIYAAVSDREITMVALTIVMNGVLLLGLLSRERRGPANIGFEGSLILALYGVGILILRSG